MMKAITTVNICREKQSLAYICTSHPLLGNRVFPNLKTHKNLFLGHPIHRMRVNHLSLHLVPQRSLYNRNPPSLKYPSKISWKQIRKHNASIYTHREISLRIIVQGFKKTAEDKGR